MKFIFLDQSFNILYWLFRPFADPNLLIIKGIKKMIIEICFHLARIKNKISDS